MEFITKSRKLIYPVIKNMFSIVFKADFEGWGHGLTWLNRGQDMQAQPIFEPSLEVQGQCFYKF